MTILEELYWVCKHISHGVLNTCFCMDALGLENIPKAGGFLLACNHVSYFDPPALGGPLERNIYFFARKTLFKPGFAEWLLNNIHTVPVDRDGASDVSALKRSLRLLQNGEGLALFPEGTRSMDGQLQEAKEGVGLMACKTQLPVIPARLFGTFDVLKRGSSLPDMHHTIQVVFGQALLPKDYDIGKHPERYMMASNKIMQAIGSIQKPIYMAI